MADEENIFGLFQGCPIHGEEFMRECTVCSAEFCGQCFPGVSICPNCSAEVDEDELDSDPDFSDVDDLDILIGNDEEVEDILRQSEEEYGDF